VCTYCHKPYLADLTEEDIDDGVLTSNTHCCFECLEVKVDTSKLPGVQ